MHGWILANTKHFNRMYTTPSTLVQHSMDNINVMQMFRVFCDGWMGVLINFMDEWMSGWMGACVV